VRADGSEVVLKVSHPNPEYSSEMAALRAYDGHGIARLLAADIDLGAMLIERLRPGTPLAEIDDDETVTRTAAAVMQQLWIAAPKDPRGVFASVEKWSRGFQRLRATFGGGTGPFPQALVNQSEAIYRDLLASSAPPALLHGDLHHWNILAAERAPWLALDPKGLLGEPAYEIGAWLRNRWPDGAQSPVWKTALQRQIDLRLGIFHEMLGFDRQRMLAWNMAQAVLSAWWSYEDHHQVKEDMLFFAQAAAEMLT